MPELPEVESIKRGLEPLILSKKIVRIEGREEKSLRVSPGVTAEGRTVLRVERRGKALLIHLEGGVSMMIHLRMTGQLIYRAAKGSATDGFAGGHPNENFVAELPNKQTRVIIVFADGGQLFFNDQRKFGFVRIGTTEEILADKFLQELGPEPWDITEADFVERMRRHGKMLIKATLLDQKIVAGLGNIYADETLFYAGVHPERRVEDISDSELIKILYGARETMTRAIEAGGSTMATYMKPDGSRGNYLDAFAQVFGREGQECRRCGAEIVKTRVAGRGTHICPNCQKKGDLQR